MGFALQNEYEDHEIDKKSILFKFLQSFIGTPILGNMFLSCKKGP